MKVSARLLASVALLSVLGTQSVFTAGAQASQTRFSPPNLPMVLSRTVIRELSGGAQIVVKRRFLVQFQRDGDGFLLTGTPIDVSVDVPPILARLGDLERQRSEQGPFPISLNGQGLIHIAGAPNNADVLARKRGQQTASEMIRAASMPEMRKREGEQLLAQLATDPRTSPWPSDLFAASNGERHQHRTVALSDGSQGEVDVLLKVAFLLPCGIPASFERVVITQLSGTRRVSRELWTLEPTT